MKQDKGHAARNRLARIEGQVRGVARMIENERYCIDVIRQIQAVKSALTGLEGFILSDHLNSCVETALKSDDLEQRREKVEELVAVLGGRIK